MPNSDGAIAKVNGLTDVLDNLTSAGDWAGVADLLGEVRLALLNVEPADKANLIQEVQQAIDRTEVIARKQRGVVGDQLTGLRLGQQATQAYESR